ncbi:hypothetical protein JCM30237_20260 [Halolamina litorea]|uniref:Uncharacterized protein n=1 Tax=Halolamina litorea TaxID=1515593 RepID=A0ABD6BUL4_9EURY|nr:hypothetical protein [Halolamina litorea]
MGIFDSLKSVLGVRAEADAASAADPDALFGMSTAYITMEAELDYRSAGAAALCFSEVDSTAFADAVDEVETILRAGEDETGTTFSRRKDGHGYHWVVLEDDDPEDLVTSVHFAADEFVEQGFGSRLLAAVFGFKNVDDATDRAYWVYSFRRGAYYPFCPSGDHDRNNRAEFKLRSVLEGELDVQDDESLWYPLWPDSPGGHPWQ